MTILISTWSHGLYAVADGAACQELPNGPVAGLASDGRGGALAIVGGTSLRRRAPDGTWSTLGTSEAELVCCTILGETVFVGTNDARVLRLAGDGFEDLRGFASTPGRDTWYAGSAIVDGRRMGPPLGIRSMATTCDHTALLANVHVGGIPRSTDAGATWQPTIEIDADVHQVCAHPSRPEVVIAAAAAGLCLSRDGGATWTIETAGLHAAYCSAAAFCGDDLLVAASTDHFAARGAVYRRPLAGGVLAKLGGLPTWLDGIADTGSIAVTGARMAIADRGGTLYVSDDAGGTWTRFAHRIPGPSNVLIV